MSSASSHAEETLSRRPPTAAQLYADAVWESKFLAAAERLICLCYADHAHDVGRPVDRAWVTTTRLMERTGLSKGAVIQARNGAINKGWLTDIGARPGHKQIRIYRLQAPDESALSSASTGGRGRDGKGRFTTEPVHSMDRSDELTEPTPSASADANMQVEAPEEETGPQDGPVHSMDADRSTAWTGTGPQAGPDSLTDSLSHSPPRVDTSGGQTEEREDHRREDQPPTEPPDVPGVPTNLAASVMKATGATAQEFTRIIEAARRDGIRSPGAWLRSSAGVAEFPARLATLRARPDGAPSGPPRIDDYRAAARTACEHGTPGGSTRCALCRGPAARLPDPEPEPGPAEPPTTSEEAAAALAALRQALDKTIRRGEKGPVRALRPRPPADEPSPAAETARAELLEGGDFDRWMTAAGEKLGHDAPRDDIVILAAELRRTAAVTQGTSK